MNWITVRIGLCLLATTLAAVCAQADNSTNSVQRHISPRQLRAMGFRSLKEYIDTVEIKDAVATLGDAAEPTSVDYDFVLPPITISTPGTTAPSPTGQSNNPNDPNHAPSGAGAGGTWPPQGGTVGGQAGTDAPPGSAGSGLPVPGVGGTGYQPFPYPGQFGSPSVGLDGIITSITGLGINSWIAIGDTVLNLIISNQPTVNVTMQPLSILPKSEPDWSQMSGWSAPVVQPCVIALVNSQGQATYTVPFTISYNADGNLNGAGHFIANLHAEPGQFQANAFYRVDLSTSVLSAVNMGTISNPIPGVEMDAQLIVHTMLTDKRIVKKYFVTGDGHVRLMKAAAGPAL